MNYSTQSYISIGETAQILGVAVVTIRRWDKLGKLTVSFRTFGNHRRYLKSDIFRLLNKDKKTICYSRVSSHDQKNDLIRQDVKLLDFAKKKIFKT
jgi:putative resolvase